MKKECKRLLYDSPSLEIFSLHSAEVVATSFDGNNPGGYDDGDWSGSGSGSGGYQEGDW